jgi:hypothetical protein
MSRRPLAPPLRRKLARRLLALGSLLGLAVLVVGVVLSSSLALAQRVPAFLVVVHPSNPETSVSREFLTDAFLKKTTRWRHDETIRPADLSPGSATRAHFSKSVLRRSVAAVRSYWQQRIFSGRGVPPPELHDDAAMVDYVAKYPGAVGYVGGDAKLEGVKVLNLH